MPSIIVDGQRYDVHPGANVLEACLSANLDLPYFCWHPAMGSIGACRQCAVVQYKDANDTTGKLTMACMTAAEDGTRVSIRAPAAVDFRASVIEWLMLNHPHDCPVCEEGGECHLQDMTLMTGHTVRRTRAKKRTFRNQYLGPCVGHEMNRCITCYRCVRFYNEYAGGHDLAAFGSRNRIYFGRERDGTLESEFSGNLVEVCPTGVFTDKPFSATYTRKWDLASAPSICPGCAVGCNTLPGERYGQLKRVHNRYHDQINGYFLCDRGRYGAAFVSGEARLLRAGERTDDGAFDELPSERAVERAAEFVAAGRLIGIGSPRSSLENNFALKTLVGAENFCTGLAAHEQALLDTVLEAYRDCGAPIPTLKQLEAADAVLILGEDVSNSAPRVALALRQTARNKSFELAAAAKIPSWQDHGVRNHGQHEKTPIFAATVLPTRIDDICSERIHAAPVEVARIGHAITHLLDESHDRPRQLSDDADRFAERAARALSAARQPLIVSGTGTGSAGVIDAAAAIAHALNQGADDRRAALQLNVPECNSLGVAMLGGALSITAALERIAAGAADCLIVLENDLLRRAPAELVERACAHGRVVVLDVVEHAGLELASLVLPAASFAESDGVFVNHEGRAQRFYRVFRPAEPIRPSWRWLADAAATAGRNDLDWSHQHDVLAACAAQVDSFGPVLGISPAAELPNDAGMAQRAARIGSRIPREPHRASGRTAMHADRHIHEPRTHADPESPLTFSMEGDHPDDPGDLVTFAWAPGWNSNQAIVHFQNAVNGPLRGEGGGVRLLETGEEPLERGDAGIPEPRSAPDIDGFVAVPLQEVFGSDELAALAPALRERAPAPYLVLGETDAERLGVGDGEGVRASFGAAQASLTLRVRAQMTTGTVGFVQGLSGGLFIAPGERLQLAADPDYVAPDAALIARLK